MGKIQRWDYGYNEHTHFMTEDEYGRWVLYADHDCQIAVKDETIAKRERMITELSEAHDRCMEEIERLKAEISGWNKYASGINEALNMWDGTYRP